MNEEKCILSCNSFQPESQLGDGLGPENIFDLKNLKENLCDIVRNALV